MEYFHLTICLDYEDGGLYSRQLNDDRNIVFDKTSFQDGVKASCYFDKTGWHFMCRENDSNSWIDSEFLHIYGMQEAKEKGTWTKLLLIKDDNEYGAKKMASTRSEIISDIY
jgi:hypothetical protein